MFDCLEGPKRLLEETRSKKSCFEDLVDPQGEGRLLLQEKERKKEERGEQDGNKRARTP